MVEPLESRTLYSAIISAQLTGPLPQTLLPGAADHLTVHLDNTGDALATGRVDVNFFISTNPAIDNASVAVGGVARHVNLKPGRAANIAVKFRVPATVASGQYFLAAVVAAPGSPSQVVPDSAPILVQQPMDSLIGKFASAPITVELDTSGDAGIGKVSLRATNPTAATVHGTVSANLYLSNTTQLDASAQWVGVLTRTGLTFKPGQSRSLSDAVTIPASAAFGTYHLLAVLKNTPAGGSNTAVFARQPITIAQGADASGDNGDDGGDDTTIWPIDTGEDGTDGAGTDTSGGDQTTNPAPPTTEDDGGGDTTQPTTDPGDDGSSGGDDSSGDDSGGDDGGGDDGGGDGGGDASEDLLRAHSPAAKPTTSSSPSPKGGQGEGGVRIEPSRTIKSSAKR